MRLLIATDSFAPKIDGVADTAGILARQLAARGHDVVVVAPAPGKALAGDVRVVRLPAFPFPLYPEVRATYRFHTLGRLIKAHRPQATLVLTVGPVGLAAMRMLPKHSPVVHLYTTDMPGYLQAYRAPFMVPVMNHLLRWMGNRSVITLCPTEIIRADLESRGVEPLGIWGRGVDTALFNPERRNEEARLLLTKGELSRPLVLFVGRLAREKRVLDLLEATRQLRHARFALVGDGPQRAELERLFPRDRTVFTGYLRGAPLAEAFAAADVSHSQATRTPSLRLCCRRWPPVSLSSWPQGRRPQRSSRTASLGCTSSHDHRVRSRRGSAPSSTTPPCTTDWRQARCAPSKAAPGPVSSSRWNQSSCPPQSRARTRPPR